MTWEPQGVQPHPSEWPLHPHLTRDAASAWICPSLGPAPPPTPSRRNHRFPMEDGNKDPLLLPSGSPPPRLLPPPSLPTSTAHVL